MPKSVDDYAKELAGLKASYQTATNKDSVAKQGQQVRSMAYADGIDLNQLEDAANKINGTVSDPNSYDEQSFRSQTFKQVQNTPTWKPPTNALSNAPVSSSGVSTSSPVQYSNQYMEKATQMMTQLEQLMNNQSSSFDYANDPTYQAAQKLAQEAANKSSVKAMETMNDRGIANSSITSSQLKQIDQQAELEPLKLVPQLQQNYMAAQQQKVSNLSGLANSLMNYGTQQQQFAAQLPMQEAALTGRYLSGDAKGLIDQLVQLKSAAESPFVTDEQLNQYHTAANQLRSKLNGMGINADTLFGEDVDASVAAANEGKAGVMTLQAQQQLLNTLQGLGQTYGKLPTGTADQVANLPAYSGMTDLFKNLEGTPTLSLQQLNEQSAARKESNALGWANNGISAANSGLSQMKYMDSKQSNAATMGWVADMLQAKSRDEAMKYIANSAEQMAADGVDVSQLWAALNAQWPTPNSANSSSGNGSSKSIDYQSLKRQAIQDVSKDPRYMKAMGKPDEIQKLIDTIYAEYIQLAQQGKK